MGKGLYKIEFVDYSKPLFLHVSNGAASASFNERLVIRAGSKNFPRLEKAFLDYLNEQVEKNYKTPLSIYINHTTIPASLRNRLLRVPADSTISLEVPRGFTSLNMNFKSDAIMLNGVSEIDSSLSTYISLFASQKPVTTTINGLAPLETAFYQLYSFSDYPLLLSRIKQNLSDDKKLKQLQQNIATIRAESGIDTDRELKEKIAHEFLVLETKDKQKLAIIRLSNGRSVNFALQLISSPLNETVSRLNYPDVFYYYLGEPLETFKTPYFVVIDNYLILSTSPEMTRRYYEAYKNERLLGFSDTYNKHRQLTANQSTITFFVNTKNSLHPIERTKGIFTNGSDNRNIGRMKGFYGLTFQLSADKGKFNTNLYTNIED